ncbi:RBBP9/YdeN family alpha/beta hydrolase [Devosia sediminis]|uniref:Alpha/beta hydrolase n=1 Tax=Devosia sediminis TaxID=2798801 RepID=A0A934J330_9HYPH|nr:alpha/beta hydrolase [Devosia sediminis]MBJ3786942.1 alpha/beta hydrolase [Devosia sediminis]
MTRPFLIVPGLNGSGEDHWQQHWLVDHPGAILVEQVGWSNPQAGRWLHRLEQAVIAHPGAVLVAHSLGTILAARLATSSVAPLVGGALLVAPADIERTSALHARTYEFGTLPMSPLPFPALVVGSRDDIYMSLDKARALATAWGAPLVDLGHVGHINVASGFGRWPGGYELARQIENQAARWQRPRQQRASSAQGLV